MRFAAIYFWLLSACITTPTLHAGDYIERRMAIELGSSAIKYAVAEVDSRTDTILEIKDQDSIALNLHDSVLSNSKHMIDQKTTDSVTEQFARLREKANYYLVTDTKVVATEAVRIARNKVEFQARLQGKTGFILQVLTQADEDQMDYFTAIRFSQKPDMPVVFDIGNNSYQLIIDDPEAETLAYKGDYGSTSFFRYLLEVVQGKDSNKTNTIHPLSKPQFEEGLRFAHHLAQRTQNLIKTQIKNNNGEVVAIGSLFQYSLLEAIKSEPEQQQITLDELEQFIHRSLNREETEHHTEETEIQPHQQGYRKHNGFSHLTLSNAIMVYGFMKELGILSLNIADRTSTDSILEYSPFWQ